MSTPGPRSTLLAGILSSIITGAAFIGTGVAFSAAAHAASPDASVNVPSDVAKVVVRYERSTLDTNIGVHTLYRRIVAAAEQVCPDAAGDPHALNSAVRACRAASVARAVRSIGSERLAALYEASQGRG